jgi:formiminotetrahydrofolate cyclodeaminase
VFRTLDRAGADRSVIESSGVPNSFGDLPVREFAARVAVRGPAPAAGATAAVVTALAAALVELAAVVSGFEHERAHSARALALELADADARAVLEEGADTTAPPLRVAEQAALVAELAAEVAAAAKQVVRADAAAAVALAAGAAAAAAAIVEADAGPDDERTAAARAFARRAQRLASPERRRDLAR